MKYFSTVAFAIFFASCLFFSETFVNYLSMKLLYLDQYDLIDRVHYIKCLNIGLYCIFAIFASYLMAIMAMFGLSLSKPDFTISERLNGLALSHFFMSYIVALVYIVGVPLFQIIINSYSTTGIVNFLLWYTAPVGACLIYSVVSAVSSVFHHFTCAFKSN